MLQYLSNNGHIDIIAGFFVTFMLIFSSISVFIIVIFLFPGQAVAAMLL